MRSTGIVRKIDELGRIVLPVDVRREKELQDKDALEVFVEGNYILLKKYSPSCTCCGESFDIVSYQGVNICPDCIFQMALRCGLQPGGQPIKTREPR